MDRTSTIEPLFTATATATGGLNGRTRTTDGSVQVDLTVPKEMGGAERAQSTTPEHLFAAGYAACFAGAIEIVGKKRDRDARGVQVTCSVSMGPRGGGGFGLSVKMHVEDRTIPQAELAELVQEAHEQVSPYSHATRNNINVQFEVVGA